MTTEMILLTAALCVSCVCLVLAVVALVMLGRNGKDNRAAKELQRYLSEQLSLSRTETDNSINASIKMLAEVMAGSQKQAFERQDVRLADLTLAITDKQGALQKALVDSLGVVQQQFKSFSLQNEQKLENIRQSVGKSIASLQEDNAAKLELMRQTVDEKLQKTLEEKLGQSFNLVNEQLEKVYKGLGEMQSLATGVGDLKKVLSNVKTRGILGEIQLGSILEQVLSPEQYATNVETHPNSGKRVEYAVKMPFEDGRFVYLPIDAKFPAEGYAKLMDAYDTGDAAAVNACAAELTKSIKSFAKDIRDKYIEPPYTTDFAIMFLPTEGLYSEVVRRGILEQLQREFHVTVAGPTTMAALLNSLQMGFRTLAVQKRSNEIWMLLGSVKIEFARFAEILHKTQKKLREADGELEQLVGVRTRQLQRKLLEVTTLPGETPEVLPEESEPEV